MLLRGVLAYALCALCALCALGAAAALPGVSVRQAGGGFYEQFDGAHGMNDELFAHSGYWSNGQPFNSGWDPSYWTVQSGILFLGLRKERFHRGNWDLPYTGGEIQTHAQYGAGCYSVCMKAPPQIGVTAGFFIQNFGEGGNYKGAPQYEIDVEFVGKWHTKVQTNYFSRNYDPNANSGSGNEQFHELGFDVTQNYAAYSFRWRKDRLDWWVNGKHIRVAFAGDDLPPIPNPEAISMKVFANIWAVNKQAEEWAGPLDHEFYETAARYNWMWHEPGENCNIMTDCGPIPPGL